MKGSCLRLSLLPNQKINSLAIAQQVSEITVVLIESFDFIDPANE